MLNNRGQLSEVMSWIVATLAIIAILLVFIFASGILAQKTKVLKIKSVDVDLPDSAEELDVIEVKNTIAYGKASPEQKKIMDDYFGGKNEEP